MDRAWHHAGDGSSSPNNLVEETTAAPPQGTAPPDDVTQTLFHEEKIAPMLDEITRALSVGMLAGLFYLSFCPLNLFYTFYEISRVAP